MAETGRSVTILPVVLDPLFTALGGPVSVEVTFAHRGNDSSGTRLGDTITRTSGSWLADGYVVGSLVRIAGSSPNATGEIGRYTVAEVTDTVLTLSTRDVLTTDATPTSLAFTRGVKPVVTELRIDQIDDVNLYSTGTISVTANSIGLTGKGKVFLGSAPYQGSETPMNILQVVGRDRGRARGRPHQEHGQHRQRGGRGNGQRHRGQPAFSNRRLGDVGGRDKPFLTNLFGASTLTARASGDVYISEHVSGGGAGGT